MLGCYQTPGVSPQIKVEKGMKPRRMIMVLLPIWLPILLILGLVVLFYTTGGMKAPSKPKDSLNGTDFANHTTFSAPSPLSTVTIPGSTVAITYWTTTTSSLASSTTAAPEAVNASSTTSIVVRAVSVPQVVLSTDSSQPTSNSLKLHNIAVGCRQLPNDTSAISGFQTQIRRGTFTSSATVTPTSLVSSPTTTAPYSVNFHPFWDRPLGSHIKEEAAADGGCPCRKTYWTIGNGVLIIVAFVFLFWGIFAYWYLRC
ncbi:hypothetical protein HYFRA_00010812 [Hymenoscyphus fraxineus]|uniref:Uncharacterized protein n=1 Tax=Hymenoscyphus fraxineus TaxID=746836 RepID=A0A9N9L0B1_9HELO|nr:hypothetical protein HYFRA_00010812 [Hymenoscyphus fraxineus]